VAVTLPGESWFLKLMGWYGDQKMKKVGSFLNFAVVLKEPHPNGIDQDGSFMGRKRVTEGCYSTSSISTISVCPSNVSHSGVSVPNNDNILNESSDFSRSAASKSAQINIPVFSELRNCLSSICSATYNSDIILGLQRIYELRANYNIAAVYLEISGDKSFEQYESDDAAVEAALDTLRIVGIDTIIVPNIEQPDSQLSLLACATNSASIITNENRQTADATGLIFNSSGRRTNPVSTSSSQQINSLIDGDKVRKLFEVEKAPLVSSEPLAAKNSTLPHTLASKAQQTFSCPTVSLGVVPNGLATVLYSHVLSASGGSSPYSYSISSGNLPNGITLSSGGILAGTPTAIGSFNFTLRVKDSNNCIVDQPINFLVGRPRIVFEEGFEEVTGFPALPAGWSSLSEESAVGAESDFAWHVYELFGDPDAPRLQLTRAAVAWFLSGRRVSALTSPSISITSPNAQLRFQHKFRFQEIDRDIITAKFLGGVLEIAIGSAGFTDIVNAGGSFLSGGYNGTIYPSNNPLRGRRAWATSTFFTTVVNLPAAAAGQTIRLRWRFGSGSSEPAERGTWNIYGVKIADGPACISDCICPSISVVPGLLPAGAITFPYSETLIANGGNAPYIFSQASGNLPPGLTLTADGLLSGTPDKIGNYVFAVRVTDNFGCENHQQMNIVIGRPRLTLSETFDSVSAPNLPNGWTSTRSSADLPLWVTSIKASDTPPNSVFGPIQAALPSNVRDIALLSPSIPIVTNNTQLKFRHNFKLDDSNGWYYTGGVLEIAVGNEIFTDIISAGGSFVSNGYNQKIANLNVNPLKNREAWSGDSIGFTTTVVKLPAAATGQTVRLRWRLVSIGGYINQEQTGWYVDTISLMDGFACTNDCTCPTLEMTPGALPIGAASVVYSESLQAGGGVGPYTFSLASGELPTGLTLTKSGLISGIPTKIGSYAFTVGVKDSNGCQNIQLFNILIGRPRVVFEELFDDVAAPNLPAGWTTTNPTSSQPLWVTSSNKSDTFPRSAFVPNPSTISDIALISPSISITSSNALLSFRHNFLLEAYLWYWGYDSYLEAYDGGVLEISIGGAAFTDIISSGGSFFSGGYNATLPVGYKNPIEGRNVWSGCGSFKTTVNLKKILVLAKFL